jgi:outer membrane receptor protein involved in Fe transport
MAPFVRGPYVTVGDAAPGTSTFGMATGDRTHRPGCNNCEGGLLYGIDNDMETDAYAAYTQGVYTFNDDYALTVGIRWAEDKKSSSEQRGGYFENNLNDPDNGFYPFSNPVFEGFCRGTFGVPDCATLGLTQISVMNMFMDAASFVPTGSPNMPITPSCELGDPNCATPLRLQGLPISFADASVPDSNTWDKVTWRVNLDWTPNEDTLLYIGATTGYRSGGHALGLLDTQTGFFDENGDQILGVTGKSRTYDEEDVIAYEAGYKATLLDGQLQIFSSVYLYDYDGYQDEVQEFQAQTGGDINVVINAGEARNMGWEIESTWLATSNWTIGGNYSYTRTEFQDNIKVFEDDNPAAPDTLFTSEQQRDAMVVDLKGNDLKRIPRHKAVLYTSYIMDFYGGTLSFGGSGAYTGSFYDSGIKRNLDKVPFRIRIDTSATWNDSRDRWRVRAFVDNVTDEGATRGIGSPGADNNWRQAVFYLYPRFYGIDVTYRLTDF